MLIENECVGCIINQSKKVATTIGADEKLSQALTALVEEMSKNFSFSQTPPEVASDVYEAMARLVGVDDLYAHAKQEATQKAALLIPELVQKLRETDEKLLVATKIAVGGNVIDLASAVSFDLHEEFDKIFDLAFAHDDFVAFASALSHAKNIVVLADNAGEHIFDYLFIQTLQGLYPKSVFTYMVRGVPIINDVTFDEAKAAGFASLCTLVNSGVNTPGFVYERASEEAKELFDKADMVISKGMGNFETLTPQRRSNICFLLKVKCQVVANALNASIGNIICKFS